MAEGEFELRMTMSDQELELVVYDLAMEEPYTLFEVASASGALVTALRQQVDDILNRVLGQQIGGTCEGDLRAGTSPSL